MESSSLMSPEQCARRCPGLAREVLDLIGTKWTPPIYFALHCASSPLRYAELQRMLGPVSAKELARHLRLFEKAGLLTRVVHPTHPPSVDYALSARGRSLYPAFEGMVAWALA